MTTTLQARDTAAEPAGLPTRTVALAILALSVGGFTIVTNSVWSSAPR